MTVYLPTPDEAEPLTSPENDGSYCPSGVYGRQTLSPDTNLMICLLSGVVDKSTSLRPDSAFSLSMLVPGLRFIELRVGKLLTVASMLTAPVVVMD